MKYNPRPVPSNSDAIPLFLTEELQRISDALIEVDGILLPEMAVSPPKPRDGMIILADGANFNPGAGKGFYGRAGSQWFPLGATQFVNVRHFGAKGDDSTDDYTAINSAITTAKANGFILYFPAGTYRFGTGLDLSDLDAFFDRGAILKPTSDVSSPCVKIDPPVNFLGNSLPSRFFGFRLDGVLTSSKTGLKVGGNGASANLLMSQFSIYNFGGTTGLGLHVEDGIMFKFDGPSHLSNNRRALYIKGTSTSLPTTLTFNKIWVFDNSDTTAAVLMESGWWTRFEDCVFEQNHARGLHVSLVSGRTIRKLVIDNCWFEQNWQDDPASTHTYDCEINGNGVDTIGFVTIRDTRFAPMDPDDDFRHCLKMRGVTPYLLSHNGYGGGGDIGVTGHVLLDTCQGRIEGLDWSSPKDLFTIQNDITTGGLDIQDDWFPTQTQEYGDANSTFQWRNDETEIFYGSALTANRTVTLSESGVVEGAWCNVTRMAGATGAFNLTIQREDATALKVLTVASTWARFIRKSGVWVLQQAGAL